MTKRKRKVQSRLTSLDVPPAWAQIEVGYKNNTLLAEAFNTDTVGGAIVILENLLSKLKQDRTVL